MTSGLKFFASAVGSAALLAGAASAQETDNETINPSLVQQGFAISPIPQSQLSLHGKNLALVGYGSYIVNATGDCTGCHTFPRFYNKGGPGSNPAAGDPYLGTPSTQSVNGQLVANLNTSHYVAGGQCFGRFMARNLTPDPLNGLPEGLTEAEFVRVMRLGEDVRCEKPQYRQDPICALGPPTPVLFVMPWPTYHSMRDRDLLAIYTYLSALPHAEPCNTVKNGCPGFSGEAAGTPGVYAFKDTPDCPNPQPQGPPPQ
jgi:hypothetical protein